MEKTVDIALRPAEAADPVQVRLAAAEAAGMDPADARDHRILKRSIDARSKHPLIRLRVRVTSATLPTDAPPAIELPSVHGASEVHIIGCGPAGLFAALRATQLGLRPVILERGKDVRRRRRDLAAINRHHLVDPDSNYCFGEGGAGTYSDGKLYTRSTKRGDVDAVLRLFVAFGASPDILVESHPHIGTNKLPGIITAMRLAIEQAGGEVHFESRVTDLDIADGRLRGLRIHDGSYRATEHVVLATGHSARDIFALLASRSVHMERKGFAMGVRIEHPQSVIDRIRYHCDTRDPFLPPASYNLVEQVNGLGVYSFCMCPGGIIAPCATAPDEVVTNGWSPSKRDNPFANSGLVVECGPLTDRWAQGHGIASDDPLAGVAYQRSVEHLAWQHGGRRQSAPAQRLMDFLGGRISRDLPPCSYPPGIVTTSMDDVLPEGIAQRLRAGLRIFGERMRGYLTNEAVLVAVESRTSSPVRIPRDPERLAHPDVEGLYPCGEGAGYAGGIVSAAMDGMRVMERIALVRSR